MASELLVLVINDDAGVAEATALPLGSISIRVLVATSAEQSPNTIGNLGSSPDLLIFDYHPGSRMTDSELIATIRRAARPNAGDPRQRPYVETYIRNLEGRCRLSFAQ